MAGGLERAVLKFAAPLLPQRWGEIARLLAVKPAPTSKGTVAVEIDDAVDRLGEIEHIVVLMLENRSFDQMLGYLSLPAEQGGRGRGEVDGLRPGMANEHEGHSYPIHHLDRTSLRGEAEDPGHSGADVHEQLAEGNGGFVASYAKHARKYVIKHGGVAPDPGLVMGYYDGDDLPVYDFLAEHFTVCDRWFSSVAGATWPNRLYAVTGMAAESHDDLKPPFYNLASVMRHLDARQVDWRWYSFDPASLRAIDPEYRFSNHHRFAYFDRRKLSRREEAAGTVFEEGPCFLDEAAAGELPAVSWIDPHFKDFGMLGPDSNDDHPPSDVSAGQDLVLSVYQALRQSACWERSLLLITYDEHGGMFDHVGPPLVIDDDPAFSRYGVRVPAVVVSPWVEAGVERTIFDHTSIIKTILVRFCEQGGRIPAMGKRVSRANHLGVLLAPRRREAIASHDHLRAPMERWRAGWEAGRFGEPPSTEASPPKRLNELQSGMATVAQQLRAAGLPAGHP